MVTKIFFKNIFPVTGLPGYRIISIPEEITEAEVETVEKEMEKYVPTTVGPKSTKETQWKCTS